MVHTDRKKTAAITMLAVIASAIILAGAGLLIFSMLRNTHYSVLGSQVHGAFFGLAVLFLGARYLWAVCRLKARLDSSPGFSWSNFKRAKGS